MVINKDLIQKEVEATLLQGKYTEGLGHMILLFADVSVYKRGIYYRYNEFEVEFIIKPKIVDMLLLKVFKYNNKFASAYTFFSMVTATAIIDAIKDVRRAEKGESKNVFYIDDVQKELRDLVYDDDDFSTAGVYMENGVVNTVVN